MGPQDNPAGDGKHHQQGEGSQVRSCRAPRTASQQSQSILLSVEEHVKAKDTTGVPEPNVELLHRTTTNTSHAEPLYSVFTKNQKRFIVCIASWAGFFSPVSGTIYLPALNALARDLNVSNSFINLTLTSYMIFQGLAPAFMGNLADAAGRRPAYIICFIIYIAANIGLALQNSYAALFILRCLQSTGSSATIAMASAVVSDIATPAERGKYMGFTIAGSLLGPAFGPVLGGVLTEYLSWRAIFWFLAIFSGAFLVVFSLFFPETARSVVGNGSIAPTGLNMSLVNYFATRRARRGVAADQAVVELSTESPVRDKPKVRFPNPWASVKIIFDRSNALLLFYNGFLFAAFYDITATIPSQFAAIYKYNDFQIGLCYIPFGAGSLVASLVNGQLLDRRFRRWCKKLNVPIRKGRDQDLGKFPIEKARLEIALPAVYASIAFLFIFGWVLHFHGPMAVLLVVLFLTTLSTGIAFNSTSTLLIDFYPNRAATATAANNLVRCLLGAGAIGLVVPMIDGMGIGWTYTFLGLFLLVSSPMLWVLMWKGMDWRQLRITNEEQRKMRKADKMAMAAEEGDISEEEQREKRTVILEDGLVSEVVTESTTVREQESQIEKLEQVAKA